MPQTRYRRTIPRGVTLVELLVVLAAGLVILGVVYQILVTTQADADRRIREEFLWKQARLIADQVSRVLNAQVDSETIGLPVGKEVFQANQCSVYTSYDYENEPSGICRATLSNAAAYEGRPACVLLVLEAQEATTGTVQASSKKILGVGSPELLDTIEFRYATTHDGLKPRWESSVGTGQPTIVEFTVTVRDVEGKAREAEITTAVALND